MLSTGTDTYTLTHAAIINTATQTFSIFYTFISAQPNTLSTDSASYIHSPHHLSLFTISLFISCFNLLIPSFFQFLSISLSLPLLSLSLSLSALQLQYWQQRHSGWRILNPTFLLLLIFCKGTFSCKIIKKEKLNVSHPGLTKAVTVGEI